MHVKPILLIMAALVSQLAPAATLEPVPLADFSQGAGGWQRRTWTAGGTPQTAPLTPLPAAAADSAGAGGLPAALALPVAFPERL
ncbi:MAG: hypothetical protein PHC30_10935, partial [Lentisphaeria bacterium]|nr:hypothetical protein [Lentisphaeria bacterium]